MKNQIKRALSFILLTAILVTSMLTGNVSAAADNVDPMQKVLLEMLELDTKQRKLPL